MFLLCMAETHGCFTQGVEIIARCQEKVMLKDKEGLLRELVKLKAIVDQFAYVFGKISVNPNSGENFANPVEVLNLTQGPGLFANWSPPVGSTLCEIQRPSFKTCPGAFGPRSACLPTHGRLHW
jgi:hypothetical protein